MNARPQPPGAAASGIVRAGEADIETLSQVIAEAFFPLTPCQWLISDETARREILPAYFRMYVEHAIAGGLVHTTPGRDAAALWIPLGAQLPGPPDGYDEHLAEVTGPWAERFAAFDAELDDHHLTGTALLNAHHAVLDEQGTTAYLEASDERTRRIYLRHGYADYGTPIHLHDGLLVGGHLAPGQPPDGPCMYPMVRDPKPHSG